MNMARKKKDPPTEPSRPGCPNCGYPHAAPPKCRACGAEIEEPVEAEEEAEVVVEEEKEEE